MMIQGRLARRDAEIESIIREAERKAKLKALEDALKTDGDIYLPLRLVSVQPGDILKALETAIGKTHSKNVKTICEYLKKSGNISALTIDIVRVANIAIKSGNYEIASNIVTLLLHDKNTDPESKEQQGKQKQEAISHFKTKYSFEESAKLLFFNNTFHVLNKDIKGLIIKKLRKICETSTSPKLGR